jgi:hypothetical protein
MRVNWEGCCMAAGTVQERMTTEFTELAEDMSVDEGLARLRAATTLLGIVTNSVGAPQVLATVQDLERAVERAVGGADLALAGARRWLPPLLVVTGDASLSAIVDSPQITLLARGARGLVVTEGSRAVGVLPIQVIKAYLSEEHLDSGRFLSELPGDPMTIAGSADCNLCGARNELEFLDPEHLPWCANSQEPDPGKHRFKPGWLQS